MANILTLIRGESGSGLTAGNEGGAKLPTCRGRFSSPCKSCDETVVPTYLLPSTLSPGYSCAWRRVLGQTQPNHQQRDEAADLAGALGDLRAVSVPSGK